MSDENPVEAGQFLGTDGAFQDGWQGLAFPGDDNEALRANPTLANIKDIRSMAKQVISGESTIGKLSGGRDFAILPNEQSTPEEVSAFHTKIGRPPSAEEYELGKDNQQKDEKFVTKMSQALFSAGASKSVAAAIEKAYGEYTTELAAALDTEDKLGNAEANKQLHTILGSGYDAVMASANVAIRAGQIKRKDGTQPISDEYAEILRKDMPYDVDGAQFLGWVGSLISEDPGLKIVPSTTGFTPADARSKANEIMTDPYYVTDSPKDKPRNKVYHDELIEKVKRLLETANA